MNVYPIEINSWVIFSENVFIKKLDKSAFLHRGTGIPKKTKKYYGKRKHKGPRRPKRS